ncbi:MAG: AI-2E family transporter [Clostridia bacterium]|nr:AI-2E family transporter [Clostridia bacterium]
MQNIFTTTPRNIWKPAVILATLVAGLILFRGPILRVGVLCLGGAVMAFLLEPLASRLEKLLSRGAASVAALLIVLAAAAGLLWLFLPAVVREAAQLMEALPRSVARLSDWAQALSDRAARHLPGLNLPELPLNRLTDLLTGMLAGTLALAGYAADILSRLSMMAMLCVFFLCDRDRLLLRLELLTPRSARCTAVRMGGAVAREVRMYLQGQLLVALAVGVLAALGLVLIGVRSAAVLGGIVGILNMVPYFGPFIGGVPAVLIALGDGWQKAALCVGVLTLVQQLDSAIISPRIMGSLTGFSPAAVLVAIYAGASFGGIVGMLAALPVLMSVRTVFRVFVQQHENN